MTPGDDVGWDRLVEVLSTVGDVSDREPHGLTVTLHRDGGSVQVVEIDMTPDEWDDMTSIGGWHIEGGAEHVRTLVQDHPAAFPYLSYAFYELKPALSDWVRD